ncbi:hypothetical protein [Aquibacillus saliphilus]|uniref:hypothetical protein n=1 Tax=Aquibacillus saliphilus TaxID=1909422 RepID=UPI001CEFF0BB|nr:hypothetical protein [Aquibacillus saliphilus]
MLSSSIMVTFLQNGFTFLPNHLFDTDHVTKADAMAAEDIMAMEIQMYLHGRLLVYQSKLRRIDFY